MRRRFSTKSVRKVRRYWSEQKVSVKKKNMGSANAIKRLILGVAILSISILLDQATKNIATEHLRLKPPISFMADSVRLQYAENKGAFLGLGNRLSPTVRYWLLTVATTLMLAGLGIYLVVKWNTNQPSFIALVLILSGGIGNMIDRIFNDGSVIDFLNLGVGPLRTGIFNIADIAITAGCILLWFSTSAGTGRTAK